MNILIAFEDQYTISSVPEILYDLGVQINDMNADLAGKMTGELMMAGINPEGIHAWTEEAYKESMALPKNTKDNIVPKLDFKKSVDSSSLLPSSGTYYWYEERRKYEIEQMTLLEREHGS